MVANCQPHLLTIKAILNDANSPSFTQAINRTHAEPWWEAMEVKLNDLCAWSLVKCELVMHS